MMSTLNLKINVYAGAPLEKACEDAVKLSKNIGIDVWFDFNGIECMAKAGDDPNKIANSWRKQFKKETKHKYASDRNE